MFFLLGKITTDVVFPSFKMFPPKSFSTVLANGFRVRSPRACEYVNRRFPGHARRTSPTTSDIARSQLTVLVVHDPERVRMQVAAKLADDDGGEPPDHLQVFRAVLVVERGQLVRTPLVGARAHVADQVHLRTRADNSTGAADFALWARSSVLVC